MKDILIFWAFPFGSGCPQYAVLAPIPNANPVYKKTEA